jgi:hypothetical protein
MESLQQVFYQRGMSARLAAIIVTVIILPLSQVRARCVAARALSMMLREDPRPL